MFAVGEEAGLLPGVSEQITGNGHFGEDDDIHMFRPGFIHHAQHGGGVFIGMPRDDFHLGHSYFQQSIHSNYVSFPSMIRYIP